MACAPFFIRGFRISRFRLQSPSSFEQKYPHPSGFTDFRLPVLPMILEKYLSVEVTYAKIFARLKLSKFSTGQQSVAGQQSAYLAAKFLKI